MRIRDYLSTLDTVDEAVEAICHEAESDFTSAPPHLGMLFQSGHDAEDLQKAAYRLRARLGVQSMIGCTAESTIATGREVERERSLAVWLAELPGVTIEPFHLSLQQTGPAEAQLVGLPSGLAVPGHPSLVLLADPFSFPVDAFLKTLGERHPDLPVIGGMASGAMAPGASGLVVNGDYHSEGAVGVLLDGSIEIRTVVSQGCRPFGRRHIVTQLEGNAILTLGSRPAYECLQEAFSELNEEDQQIFQTGPLLGQAMSELKDSFGRGDFLVRGILGADSKAGSLMVGDRLRRGQTVQFHVRDAGSASEDLSLLLQQEQGRLGDRRPVGGLLFTCNGRGTRLFNEESHDVGAVRKEMGQDMPLAGFFAAGEIGPVGGTNFVHGYTASLALLFEGKSTS
jgi:small ligand-binding sensory domain FIST